jgi:hypothetical protein
MFQDSPEGKCISHRAQRAAQSSPDFFFDATPRCPNSASFSFYEAVGKLHSANASCEQSTTYHRRKRPNTEAILQYGRSRTIRPPAATASFSGGENLSSLNPMDSTSRLMILVED